MKRGIAIAGSVLVDKINEIATYPMCGELTAIKSVSYAVGGCVPNVAIDLKKLSPDLEVAAVAKIGNDKNGEFVLSELCRHNVDVKNISYGLDATSFTEVMSIAGGQRTFFTYKGASAEFGADDVNFDLLNIEMLHLGYFLLLDRVDSGDGEIILKEAHARGIKTSIDLVSSSEGNYERIKPCLQYVDNLIINEMEAGNLAGIDPTDEDLIPIAQRLKGLGVRNRVIIHTPALGLCVSDNGCTVVPSYKLPDGFIKGSTGAGDAFAAGALLGIYRDLADDDILKLASRAATAALSSADATSGLDTEEKIAELTSSFKRRKICL